MIPKDEATLARKRIACVLSRTQCVEVPQEER